VSHVLENIYKLDEFIKAAVFRVSHRVNDIPIFVPTSYQRITLFFHLARACALALVVVVTAKSNGK
jgi:hypothetical protein